MATKSFCLLSILIVACATKIIHADGMEGGVSTKPTSHPYYVVIQRSDGTPICAGALISENIVVTAAQCIAHYDVSKMVVRVGSDDYSKPGKVITIATSKFEKSYDSTTNENDVGLLKLAKKIQKSPTVSVIPLATSQPKSGTNAVLTGLDKTKKLTELNVVLINKEKVNSQLNGLAISKNACGGNPGNPLVSNNQLVGLLSRPYGCPNNGNPAIYTNIATLKSWITSTAKSL